MVETDPSSGEAVPRPRPSRDSEVGGVAADPLSLTSAVLCVPHPSVSVVALGPDSASCEGNGTTIMPRL